MAKKKNDKKEKIATASQPLSNTYFWFLPIVLAITTFVFSNSLSNDFVNWDDPINLLENKNLDGFTFENIKSIFSSTIIGNYNPLPIFTFAIEKAIFGLNPTVYHFNNLLLHLICTFLVYRLLIQLNYHL